MASGTAAGRGACASPDQPGRWKFKTACSDTANTGLHEREGEFTCSAPLAVKSSTSTVRCVSRRTPALRASRRTRLARRSRKRYCCRLLVRRLLPRRESRHLLGCGSRVLANRRGSVAGRHGAWPCCRGCFRRQVFLGGDSAYIKATDWMKSSFPTRPVGPLQCSGQPQLEDHSKSDFRNIQ